VLFTCALGIAAGDLVSERRNLGHWLSAVLFGLAIAAVALAHFMPGLDAVWSFWIGYVLTRPLGASIGDYLSQPSGAGGLGLGTAITSALFLTVILGLVGFLPVTRKDVAQPQHNPTRSLSRQAAGVQDAFGLTLPRPTPATSLAVASAHRVLVPIAGRAPCRSSGPLRADSQARLLLTTITLFLIFVVTLVVQLGSSHCNPFFYWTVILSTSMAGTTMSDFMNRDASARYLSGRGTSLGDFLSDSSGLGYAGGALLVTGALAVLAWLMKVPVVPNVLLFRIAFVLTRPLGATAGDLLTKPVTKGGLDLGTAGSSAVLPALLVGLMAYAQVRERGTPQMTEREPVARRAD
jgi:uncharacterized membrane-anchored protein